VVLYKIKSGRLLNEGNSGIKEILLMAQTTWVEL
jgi:hypothetical protein